MIDKFASRYGWDKEKILSLPACDFIGLYSAMMKDERQKFDQDLKVSAFTGWQFLNHIGAILGAKDLPGFLEYSDSLSLLNDEEKEMLTIHKQLKRMENKRAVQRNLDTAAQIIELDRHRKE